MTEVATTPRTFPFDCGHVAKVVVAGRAWKCGACGQSFTPIRFPADRGRSEP